MNEKRQGFNKFKEGKTELELSLENLIALTSSLEAKARAVGALTVLRELTALRKAAQRTNGNKKILKSIQKKYEMYQQYLENLQPKRKTR